MESIAQSFRRLWYLLRRRKFQQELAEEMAFHREQVAAEHRADGLARGAAEQAAKRQIGNQELLLLAVKRPEGDDPFVTHDIHRHRRSRD